MANLLEEVVLLAYRDDNGRNVAPYLQQSLAAAALAELTLSERIDIDDSARIGVTDPSTTGQPALDETLKRLSESKINHIASSWVQILSGVDLRTSVLEGLVEQRILTHDSDRLLGFIPVNRYRPAEARVEDEIRARLERAFTHGVGADARTAVLAGIVSTTFMEKAALPQHTHGEVHKTFRALGQDSPGVKKVLDATELAVAVFRSGSGVVPAT